jgi:hypothetical protein
LWTSKRRSILWWLKCCDKCWLALGWRDAFCDAYKRCMPRILYASTTQTRVSPPALGVSKVWSKAVLFAPCCLGYIWMP